MVRVNIKLMFLELYKLIDFNNKEILFIQINNMQDANSVLIRYIVNVHLKAHGEIRHGGVIEKKDLISQMSKCDIE